MKTEVENRKLRTCLWIVNQLRIHKEGLTLVELNGFFRSHEELSGGEELPRNSFLNYKRAILDLFSINIECNRSTNKYQIEEDEASDLAAWLLNSFSVGQTVREQQDVRERILLEPTPRGMRYFSQVVEAIREQLVLQVTYQKFADTEPYDCRIEPYCVKLDEGRWYLLGRKNEADHLQSFAFDRIMELSLLSDHYEYVLPFDPQSHYRDSFGIFTSPEPEEVLVRVYAYTYNYLHTKPLHHSQQEELLTPDPALPMEERVWLFRYHIRPSIDFKNELLRWGAGVEVISPAHFREEMREVYRQGWERYCPTGKV